MPSALILIADGTEEIEFVTPYDIFVRAGIEVKPVGIKLKESYATCSRNVRITPDTTTLPSSPTTDILVLPGGAPGAAAFCSSPAVLSLLRAYRDAGKWVATICAATTALVAATADGGKTEGLESSKKCIVTSHPSVRAKIEEMGWEWRDERVYQDGKVITSMGPGTAGEFALEIVGELCGQEKREEVARPMIWKE